MSEIKPTGVEAALREALEKIERHGPIMGSTGDYRQGQLDILENVSTIASLALANVKGDSRPPEGERGDKAALPNDGGTPTQGGAGVNVRRLVRRRPSSRTFRITTAPERNGITAAEVKTALVRRFPEWEWVVQELDEQGNLMTPDGRSIITPNKKLFDKQP